VGVIDTGIDYDHPDLGGCFGPRLPRGLRLGLRRRCLHAARTIPVPALTPMTAMATARTWPASSAPTATLSALPPGDLRRLRVFGCDGYTWGDIMIAAMEMALADGMDVREHEHRSAFQWPQYPTAMAASNLVNMGVVVVASIGNSGANGVYSAGAPGLGEKVIGVASFDNTTSRCALLRGRGRRRSATSRCRSRSADRRALPDGSDGPTWTARRSVPPPLPGWQRGSRCAGHVLLQCEGHQRQKPTVLWQWLYTTMHPGSSAEHSEHLC
jgi:hypothetical protein